MTEPEARDAKDILDLLGEQTITLSDKREIRVHAYSFLEGLRLTEQSAVLVRGLTEYFKKTQKAEEFDLAGLQSVFAEDLDGMIKLLAQASDLTEVEIAELDDNDGSQLMWAWWNLNASFFMRRLITEVGAQATVRKATDDGQVPHGFLRS